MSLLGFDAIGRLALGQIQNAGPTTTVLVADVGAFSIAGQAAKFAVLETANQGAISVSPVNASTEVFEVAAPGALALSGISATLRVIGLPAPLALAFSGAISFTLYELAQPGALVITPLDVPLTRTGADFELVYGGIGHYLEEVEKQRQLARITRKTPAPIDRTTAPTFKTVASPPIAPPAPVINLQAAQNERMAAQQAATAQAATIKRRRQEEELLLLAS